MSPTSADDAMRQGSSISDLVLIDNEHFHPYASHTDSNLGIERTDSCGSAIAREICA